MHPPSSDHCAAATHELRFVNLFDAGRALAFPCDAAGLVDMDALGEVVRANYLYARTVVGREFAMPVTCPAASATTPLRGVRR